jgi:hypothetical protein
MSDDKSERYRRMASELRPWERSRTSVPGIVASETKSKPEPKPKPKPRKANPQVQIQPDRVEVELLRGIAEAESQEIPLGDPPVENGAGAFEFASPDPENFSEFENPENDPSSDDQDPEPRKPTRGRKPPPFRQEYIAIASRAMSIGFTIAELASLLGCSAYTLKKWIFDYPKFGEAVKMHRGKADDRIERNLFQRACGYEFIAEKPMNVAGKLQVAQYKEHVKPDVVAQIFWLKNRRPEAWRDVQQHEHGNAGEFANMNNDQLLEEIKKASEQLQSLDKSKQH